MWDNGEVVGGFWANEVGVDWRRFRIEGRRSTDSLELNGIVAIDDAQFSVE
jgi:hypothetical protein